MTNVNEVSPPGWGHTKAEKEKTKPNKPKSKIGGTAHAMKLAQKRGDIPKKMNIFALMWSMKNKGDKPHYKPGVKDKLKKKYKGPEGQNEEKKVADQYPPTRLFKNVPNSTVKKANKEGEKAKKDAEKAVLGEPPKSGPSGENMHSKDNVYEDGELVSLVAQAINELTPEQKKAREASRTHSTLGKGRRLHGGRSAAHPKGPMVSGKTHTYDKPAGTAKKPGRQKIVATPVKKEETEVEEDTWSKNFKKQGAKRRGETRRRQQAQQHSPGQRVPPKTKNYGEDMSLAPKGKGKKAAKALYKECGDTSILSQQQARIAGRPDISKKKQKLSITPAGKKALKKGDQKLSITAKGRAAVKEITGGIPVSKKMAGTTVPPKQAPRSQRMDKSKNLMPAPGWKTRKAGNKPGEMSLGSYDPTLTHFGDVLRQAIAEAKKVSAIDTINKIVKTKTIGKIHNQKVDLFTASAIQQVYNAINQKNKEKMNSVMSKDVHGLLKMADFSMSKMKR